MIDDASRFASMRDEWTDLLRDSAADGPFLTWEWLHAWWTHLAAGRSLNVIAVRVDGTLVAVAPLCVSRGPVSWLSHVEFLGGGDAGSDYLDLIVRRGYEAAGVAAIAQRLDAQRLTLRFRNLRPAALASQLPVHMPAARWTAAEAPSGVCPTIPLSGHSFDSYLATLGSAHRANVRRRLRALRADFDVRFERMATDAGCDESLLALFAFHAQRWNDRGGSSAFHTSELRAFHRDAARLALERGWLAMYALRLNDTIAASMYGFAYGGRFYFYQHGFDDRFRRYSVGLALMGLTIEAAIQAGAREFDMLWGEEPYKRLWARDAARLTALTLFPAHLGGAIHRRAAQARRGARTFVDFVTQGASRAT